MDKNYIYAFIDYGINKNLTVKQLIKSNFSVSVFYLIGVIYGCILGFPEYIFSILIMLVMLLFTVFNVIKSRHNTLKNTLTIMAAISLEATINFTLFALILCNILTKSLLLKLTVITIPIIITAIYFYITKHSIKSGTFLDKKKVKKNKIYLYSLLGGTAGILAGRIFLNDVSQFMAIKIGIICVVFLAACFSLGTINILKLYYIKKLNL